MTSAATTHATDAAAVLDAAPVTLRATMAVGGAATVLVLSGINVVDYSVSAALSTLGPDIERSLHLSDTQLSMVALLTGVFFVLAAVPVGRLSDRVPRPLVIGGFALLAAAGVGLTAAAKSLAVLAVARIVTGAGQSEIQSVHLPLLADAYPESGRSRVFAVHTLGPSLGSVVGPLAAGSLAVAVGGPSAWRWPLGALAVVSGLLALSALRLPERRAGGQERPVRLGAAAGELARIRTFRVILVAIASLGAGLLAAPILLGLYFERVQHLDALGRGIAISTTEIGSVLGIALGALLWERAQRGDTTWAVRVFALALALSAVLLPAALRVPAVVPAVAFIAVAKACQSLGLVPLYAIIAAIVPSRLQALAFGALGVAAVVVGGAVGATLGGGLSDAHGPVFAITTLSLGGGPIAAALVLRTARTLPADLARPAAAEEPVATGAGLAVQGATVSREGRTIVRDVTFSVAPGEVLALLGTNGSGKSTLLRALSGLLPLDQGRVLVDGRDLTFEPAPARVGHGLVQVPGGQAVFNGLSALENLLVGMHSFGWDRDRQEVELQRVLALLPELRQLLDTPAGVLSGGEQQILALAKALLLRPSVLLIDELSLGLAPVVVGRLLQVVEQVRDVGVAVVLVEQSLNVAATLASRAVFLDRGRVVFEGPPADLLDRDDLARSIFLKGDLVDV